MRKHRGLIWVLALSAVIGFSAGEARAGTITMVISWTGHTVTVTPGSAFALAGSTNNSLQVDTTALNTFLAANGSAYQFSNLGASSDYPGQPNPTGGTLNETGTALMNPGATGATAITVNTTLTGYTQPTGPGGSVASSATAIYTNTAAGDSQNANGSWAIPTGAALVNSPTITFVSPGGMSVPPFSASNTTPVPTITAAGYDLDNHATISLTPSSTAVVSDQFGVAVKLITAVPEPASLVLMLTSMPLPLVVVGLLRRRRRAVG
jgi:hypothetical protein